MRWSEGRGAGDGWEGQSGEELLPRSGQQLAPESREWAGENTNDAPPPLQVLHFSGEWGCGGGRREKGGVNKRPQLLTVRLVFRPPPPTRSKEARAGGVTGEGRRGWEKE